MLLVELGEQGADDPGLVVGAEVSEQGQRSAPRLPCLFGVPSGAECAPEVAPGLAFPELVPHLTVDVPGRWWAVIASSNRSTSTTPVRPRSPSWVG